MFGSLELTKKQYFLHFILLKPLAKNLSNNFQNIQNSQNLHFYKVSIKQIGTPNGLSFSKSRKNNFHQGLSMGFLFYKFDKFLDIISEIFGSHFKYFPVNETLKFGLCKFCPTSHGLRLWDRYFLVSWNFRNHRRHQKPQPCTVLIVLM